MQKKKYTFETKKDTWNIACYGVYIEGLAQDCSNSIVLIHFFAGWK